MSRFQKQSQSSYRLFSWRPRLLPIAMVTVALMIFDRSWNLIHGIKNHSLMATPAYAEEKATTSAEKSPASDPEPRREINTSKSGSLPKVDKKPEEEASQAPKAKDEKDKGKDEKPKNSSHDSAELSEADILSTFDPMQMSESQIKLLLSLSARRKQIEKKEDKLEQDAAVLELMEKRIEEQLKKLEVLKGSVESSVKKYDDQENKKILELVKIYEGMKPAAAAHVFDELPLSILLPVVQQMNKRKVAPILALMDVKKVKHLTTKLAEKTPIPGGDSNPTEPPPLTPSPAALPPAAPPPPVPGTPVEAPPQPVSPSGPAPSTPPPPKA